jgi:uncharacterized protein (DUF1697 family)
MGQLIALLRGINVGGHKRVPMAELRELAAGLGFEGVLTYIQSGTLVLRSARAPDAVAAELERALEKHFGFPVDVVVRTAAQWGRHVRANPLGALAARAPKAVLLGLAARPIRPAAARELSERATRGERVEVAAGAIYLHYAAGVAGSKLTPALIDRCAGASVTARNWNTVLELERLAARPTGGPRA